jgi:nitrite reductase/ring-hydroxylating ferredoxin subunit
MPTKIELCNASDVAVGTVLKVERDDLTLAVFNIDGEYFVTDDHCTHGPGSLSEGFVEGDVVECNFHGGQSRPKSDKFELGWERYVDSSTNSNGQRSLETLARSNLRGSLADSRCIGFYAAGASRF